MDPFLPTAMLDWHHLACIAREAWTMEAVTIVGSRPANHVELEGGLKWMGVMHDRYCRWTGRNVNWEA